MLISKKYLIEVIKQEINLLLEDRDTYFKSTVESVKDFAIRDRGGLEILRGSFYHLITKDHRFSKYVKDAMSAPGVYEELKKIWLPAKQNLINYAQSLNWKHIDDGVWFQFDKPFHGSKPKESGSFKRYLTFKKVTPSDPKLLIQENKKNINLIPHLLYYLNLKQTKGKVSFKISSQFIMNIDHLDNVVIHYKNKDDQPLIDEAVKETGFDLEDRSQFNRLDHGVDTHTSDSMVVAEKCAENILRNKEYFKANLSLDPNSVKYKEAVQAIQDIVVTISLKSSHRN